MFFGAVYGCAAPTCSYGQQNIRTPQLHNTAEQIPSSAAAPVFIAKNES